MDNLIEIISNINLLKKDDFEKFNSLVARGYDIIKSNKKIENTNLYNSFILSIDDYNSLKKDLKCVEDEEFVKKLFKKHTYNLGEDKFYLSSDQMDVLEKIKSQKNFVFSMPTSFGKSMLMRVFAKEMSKKNKRVIIIAPTISLMNEYHAAFRKMDVASSTSSFSKEKILILTQERATNIEFNSSDSLLVDEAYVLGNDDDRAGILYHVIYKAWKNKVKIKMFVPNIKDVKKLFNKENFSNIFNYKEIFKSLSTRKIKKPIEIKNRKGFLEKEIKNDGLKYCIFDQKKFVKKVPNNLKNNSLKKPGEYSKILIEYLEEEFGEQYYLLKALKRGVVVSHGDVPKQFRFISELMYKSGEVKVIASTGTMTKGVNINPDVIILMANNFYQHSDTDVFELRNAIGRSGRYNFDIKKRIGRVLIAGTSAQYKNFINKFNLFTKDFIDSKLIEIKENKNPLVESFDFNQKENIDWVLNKFGINEKKIYDFVIKNKLEFKKYIEYKYFSKKKDNKTYFDNIWNILISIPQIENKIYKLYHHDPKNMSEKMKNYILNLCKYQGFNENLKPERTYISSAKSELYKLKNREEKLFTNFSIIAIKKESKNFIKISKKISLDEENKILDILIERKANVKGRFIESFLNPLDYIISKSLGTPINEISELDQALEENNIPLEFRRVLIKNLDTQKDYDKHKYSKIIKNNIFFKSLMLIMKNNKKQ